MDMRLILIAVLIFHFINLLRYQIAEMRFYKSVNWDFTVISPIEDQGYSVTGATDKESLVSNRGRVLFIRPLFIFSVTFMLIIFMITYL